MNPNNKFYFLESETQVVRRCITFITYFSYLIANFASAQPSELSAPNFAGDGYVSARMELAYNNTLNNSLDFGFLGNGTISGHLWIDYYEYEIIDEGIDISWISQANVKLQMYNDITDTWVEARGNVATNDTGYYLFKDLFAGKYRIVVDYTKSPKYDKNDTDLWECTTPGRLEVILEKDSSSVTRNNLGYDITD